MDFILPLLLVMPTSGMIILGSALSIGVMIVGSMFMVAYALQHPPLVAVAREEFSALIFTVFIVMFWLLLDTTLSSISVGIMASSLPSELAFTAETLQGLDVSHVNLALASLDIMDQKLRHQYMDLYLFEALIGFLSTVSFPLGSPVPAVNVISFSVAPFTGLVLLSNAHTTIVEAIGYMITLVWAKEFILLFSRDAVTILLLPLGVMLRVMPFFRKTGSSVIAMAFALYYIFPFAILLSNYLIFDIYQPTDFAYTPVSSSFFGTERSHDEWNTMIEEGSETHANQILDQFTGEDVVEQAHTGTAQCAGNFVVRMLCSLKNVLVAAFSAVGSFFSAVATIWRFMVGMTGDFFYTGFNNPLLPASASAGLYYFIIREVATISPFIILIILTTVIEIVITVTMYRNISMLIGGEAEIVGLTKLV
jgi:hypothetical protein